VAVDGRARPERGVVLLEVLAAALILTVAGLSLTELAAAGVRAAARAGERERVAMDEDRLMTAYSLLLGGDLDLRLGDRDVGPYRVRVERPEPALYRVAISEQRSPDVQDLVTVLYRPEPPHAP
jgi:hypothetical protein